MRINEKNKKTLIIVSIIVLVLATAAITILSFWDPKTKVEFKPAKVVISADKQYIKADNLDMVTFTVSAYDENGKEHKDVQAVIFVDDLPISSYRMTSMKNKTYIVYAMINNVKSESIEIYTSVEGDLPILVLDIDMYYTPKDMPLDVKVDSYLKGYFNGTMKLIDNKNGNNHPTDLPKESSNIGIKVRGQSSAVNPKRSFTMQLTDEIGGYVDIELLAMPKDHSWVLYAPYNDKSLIRNYVVYNTTSQLMYAPRCRFADVYITTKAEQGIDSNTYQGVYMICEKIGRSTERVQIQKNLVTDKEPSFITARDKLKEGEKSMWLWGGDMTFVYPDYEDMQQSQIDYITNYMKEAEKAILSPDFKDPEKGYRKYFDVDSLIDFCIMQDYFKVADGFSFSTYFYKDKGGKLMAGPMWDADYSMGNFNFSKFGIMCDSYREFLIPRTKWISNIFLDPYFSQKYVERYKELRKTVINTENVLQMIDEANEIVSNASVRNFIRWPEIYNNEEKDLWPNPKGSRWTGSLQEEINVMKEWVVKRGEWMDQNIDKLTDQQYIYNIGTIGEPKDAEKRERKTEN